MTAGTGKIIVAKRKVRLKKRQGICVGGPVRIWVSRGVTLIVEADPEHAAPVTRLDRPPSRETKAAPTQSTRSGRGGMIAEQMLAKARRLRNSHAVEERCWEKEKSPGAATQLGQME
jgi:hypothetical protein